VRFAVVEDDTGWIQRPRVLDAGAAFGLARTALAGGDTELLFGQRLDVA
jgi:hypothetical protein